MFPRSTVRKLTAWLLLPALLAGGVLRAQGEAESAPAEVSIRFNVYLFSLQGGVSRQTKQRRVPKFHYWNGGSVQAFQPKEGTFTPKTFEYRGPIDGLKFYASQSDLEAGQKPLAKVKLQAVWKEMVLILIPSGQSYKVLAIDKSAAEMKEGSLRLYNMSVDALAVDVGGIKQQLGPRRHFDFREMQVENRQTSVKIGAQVREKWKLVYSSYVKVREDSRKLMLIYKLDDTGRRWTSQTIEIPKL